MADSRESDEIAYEFYPVYDQLWVEGGDTRVRGGGFLDGEYYDMNALAELVSPISSRTKFAKIVDRLNGFFAIVHRTGGELLIATDRIRSIPLFYAAFEDTIAVGTDSARLEERVGCQEYGPLREAEYILTGYVTGHETLCDDINQVQAGELVSLTASDAASAERIRYYQHRHNEVPQATEHELLDGLDRVLISAFERLIEYADGRPIVVSMSGGYDSRLLVSMLVRLGYDDVIAFTYDHAGDEAEYCRNIAETLDIRWEYVRQTHEEWWDWYHSEERERLDRTAGIIDAVPTNGPAIAIKKLREQNRVPEDSLIVTGDSPTTSGERIPASLRNASDADRELLTDSILESQYELWEYTDSVEAQLRDRVLTGMELEGIVTTDRAVDLFEYWDQRERQAKHTLRGDVYDFWEFDWWYPLWDDDFVEFTHSIPIEYRYRRRLYKKYVRNLYSHVANLPTSEVEKSFFERSEWISKIEQKLTGTPLKEPAERIYRQHLSPREYRDNPIWGIMREDQFESVHSGRQVVHAFRVLDVLGRMSFNPRKDGLIAKSGVVRLQNSTRAPDTVSTGTEQDRRTT